MLQSGIMALDISDEISESNLRRASISDLCHGLKLVKAAHAWAYDFLSGDELVDPLRELKWLILEKISEIPPVNEAEYRAVAAVYRAQVEYERERDGCYEGRGTAESLKRWMGEYAPISVEEQAES